MIDTMFVASCAVLFVVGYLLGGVPTAFVVGRLRGVDIRRLGSGNVGGTNALRVWGAKVGVAVMAADVAKGFVAAGLLPNLPWWVGDRPYLGLCAGGGAVVGHILSPYLRFRGGKGVAAAAGVLLALAPLPTAIAVGVFALVVLASGIVSVASLTAAATLPLAAYLLHRTGTASLHPAVQALTLGLVPVVFFTHRANIRRLVRGEENRFRRLWERRGGRVT
ncbi:MAG: Acyl-phosphate:glycerol-3-phosphate O-acyltransferase PlsY [Candidatus Bipolaricaulis sibiricus]|uniref:Glycerol-3-phosphate acyltransferase n=1 Tax=Bipolaricaulis sibiricus TaxID=2501609 RepID=A0A410FUN6_BIPS1|nr:MAG: Acyl-phosphate:glycerol-3-phosphate O-acyltransferase PlsY [Candidatus Bipolaricaulis sibiricus]